LSCENRLGRLIFSSTNLLEKVVVDSREAAVSQPNWEFYWEQSASVEQADLIHNYSQLIHNAQGRSPQSGT